MLQLNCKKVTKPFLVLFLSLLLLFFTQTLQAAESGDGLQRSRLQMNRVIKQLMDEKKALSRAEGEKNDILTELDNIDRTLSEAETSLDFYTRQQKKAEADLPILEEKIRIGRFRVKEMQNQLKAHLRLMYGMGGQGVVKVALSQDNAARVRQSVLYYGRLIKSRNDKFKAFNASLEELNRSVSEHKILVAKVGRLREKLMVERQNALISRHKRTALFLKLQQETRFHQKKIEELTLTRSSLSSFMERLTAVLSSNPPVAHTAPDDTEIIDVPATSVVPKPNIAQDPENNSVATLAHPLRKVRKRQMSMAKKITQIRGDLPLPVFAEGQSRRPGLFFPVAKNSKVKAIYHAQVVYADWFRGYGLLIILNHGDEIYSLYGHNNKLLVTPGDWVDDNQVIAYTGDTGSLEGIPGLYFEIRRRGKAENPYRWLTSARR
ncbi:MAG: peptidoglycan DD-metalloendopeptidase family protein [Magnetococcales bacterium]|nr:peptidoglycan DD-metalloendopeptidase family protein [Magnetococcales bacterium]